jgi:hypothetical protein
MLRKTLAITFVGLILSGVPSDAQEGPSDSARYTFYRVQDNFIRLDLRTGHVSHCGWVSGAWSCRVLPDERTALESEISWLRSRNLALKKELLAHGLGLPDGIKPEPAISPHSGTKTPGMAELEWMKSIVENAWRRMVETMASLQREILRKS